MDSASKVRENRVRRVLERRLPGLRLKKTRRRDPLAADYGTFQVVNAKGLTAWRFQSSHKLTLDEIEKRLQIRDEEDK